MCMSMHYVGYILLDFCGCYYYTDVCISTSSCVCDVCKWQCFTASASVCEMQFLADLKAHSAISEQKREKASDHQ